jgi:hypothetical protein
METGACPPHAENTRLRGDDGPIYLPYRFRFSISTAMPCPAPMHMLMTA